LSVVVAALSSRTHRHGLGHQGFVATTASIEIRLKINSQTAISARAVDDQSNETTLIVVGLKDEVIAIPRDNIALVVMDEQAAEAYLAQLTS
jgi:hypothetical protein